MRATIASVEAYSLLCYSVYAPFTQRDNYWFLRSYLCVTGFKLGPVLESAAAASELEAASAASAAALTLVSATTTSSSSLEPSGFFAAGLVTSRALTENTFSKRKQKQSKIT